MEPSGVIAEEVHNPTRRDQCALPALYAGGPFRSNWTANLCGHRGQLWGALKSGRSWETSLTWAGGPESLRAENEPLLCPWGTVIGVTDAVVPPGFSRAQYPPFLSMHPAHSHSPARSPRKTSQPTPMTTQPPSRPAPSRVIFHHDVARLRRGAGGWCCGDRWGGQAGMRVTAAWGAQTCAFVAIIVWSPRWVVMSMPCSLSAAARGVTVRVRQARGSPSGGPPVRPAAAHGSSDGRPLLPITPRAHVGGPRPLLLSRGAEEHLCTPSVYRSSHRAAA